MSTKKRKAIRSEVAKEIAKFEKNLFEAKNDYFRVLELNRMQDIIEAEILHWCKIVKNEKDRLENAPENNKNKFKKEFVNVRNNAAKHISEMEDIIKTLNKFRLQFMKSAEKIRKAMKNSNEEVENIEYESDLEQLKD